MNIDLELMVPGDEVWCVEITKSDSDGEGDSNEYATRNWLPGYYIQGYIQKGVVQRVTKPDGSTFNIVMDSDFDTLTRRNDTYIYYATKQLAIEGLCEQLKGLK